jgi:hypothetical protein
MIDLLPLLLIATLDPAPPDPFLLCAWHGGLPVAGQNIGFTAFGYAGVERGFRIHQGNYDSAGDHIDYTIELIWNLGECSGTVYKLRFPDHGLTNHVEIEVRSETNVLMGRLEADKGSLPALYNQNNNALPFNKLGPFVIGNQMIGGANGMAETVTFTLLDAEILARLPAPIHYNGAPPANAIQTNIMNAAYDSLVAEYEYFFTFFTFRRLLGAMTAAEREDLADAFDNLLADPGPIHGDPYYEEHHHVNHGVIVGPAGVAPFDYGGFFNGHRNFMGILETGLEGESQLIPFRRIPAWDPATTIPAEVQGGVPDPITGVDYTVGNPAGGSDLDADYKAANICANYANANSALPTLEERLAEMEETLGSDVQGWHNGVHVAVGGDFVDFDTTAGTHIFHPWHTAIDTIWRNWQLCEAGYHPNKYSWDEL